MKKIIGNATFIILLVSILLCLAGCNKQDGNEGAASNSSTGADEKVISIDTGKYNAETDAQSFFIWGSVAQTKNGFYFLTGQNIMFFDATSKQIVPLCNRPNCSHDYREAQDCNASLMGNDSIAMSYDTPTIQYHEGDLYISGCDHEGYDCIYKISQDGSTREKYMKLYRSGMTNTTTESYRRYPSFLIHRGYVYYINEMEETQVIRRMKMGKDEAEVVYTPQGERATVYRMKAYGDYLVFQTGNFAEDMINIEARICAYNVKTGELGTIVENVYNEYHIFDGKVYYTTQSEIRCYDMKTKEDVAIIEGNNGYYNFCLDDTYIYTFEDGGILRVYTHDGEIKCTVVDESVSTLYYVHEGYLLSDISAEAEIKFGVIEVTDFKDGNATWEIYKYKY